MASPRSPPRGRGGYPPISKIEVEIEVANQTVKAGEQVRLTAQVQTAPPETKILYSWTVVDGQGTLTNADQSTVIYIAPSSVGPGEVKLNLLQVTVTLISQHFSSNRSNMKIEKEIQSVTKTVAMTVV